MISWGETGASSSVDWTWNAAFGLANVTIDQTAVVAAITAIAARRMILRISSPFAPGRCFVMEYGQPRLLIRQPHINQSLRGVARMIRVLCDAPEIGMQRVAEHGEHNCRFAFKKRAAQLLLQPDNGVSQRRLGDAAASGCPRETALLAQRQKIPNLVHFHGPTHVAAHPAGSSPACVPTPGRGRFAFSRVVPLVAYGL